MADVFISYKRDERQAVERLAAKLRQLGLNIWFDASMSAGETFNSEIDREARAAKAILVCWSPTARESRWVIAEAMIGFEQDKLAACHVAGPDGFSPPTPFNTSHAEDLRAWLAAPSETHAGWRSVLRRIGKLCGRPDIESWGALDAQASAVELRAWIVAHEQSPLFMAVEAMLRDRETQDAERARLEEAARKRQAREEVERRAREEAERKVREETERRTQIERDAHAQREAIERMAREGAERTRETQAQQAGRNMRLLWWLIAGAAVLAIGYFGVSIFGRGSSDCVGHGHAIVRVLAPDGPAGVDAAMTALRQATHVTGARQLTAERAAALLAQWNGSPTGSADTPPSGLIEIDLAPSPPTADVSGDIVASLAQGGVTAQVIEAPCR